MGCHTQEAAEEVAGIPGVDVVVGTDGRRRIVDLVEEVMVTGQPVNAVSRVGRSRDYEEIPATHIEGKARAVIKVQDGCDEFCSYCVIPRLRGRSRSRLLHHVLQEAQDLVAGRLRGDCADRGSFGSVRRGFGSSDHRRGSRTGCGKYTGIAASTVEFA